MTSHIAFLFTGMHLRPKLCPADPIRGAYSAPQTSLLDFGGPLRGKKKGREKGKGRGLPPANEGNKSPASG